MARVEADREDLMQEAVALVRRVEFTSSQATSSIIVGFRSNGWFSVYLGQDWMSQFDTDGRLRRAYRQGLLYRTQGQTLAQLRRHRTDSEMTLLRHDLDEIAMDSFRRETHAKIVSLINDLTSDSLTVAQQIPADDATLICDVRQFLQRVMASTQFLAPAIPGKS